MCGPRGLGLGAARLRRDGERDLRGHGRALVAALVTLGLVLTTSCGQVVFVDPDRALKASLVVTRAERLRIADDPRDYFHVRIATRQAIDRVRLLAARGADRFPLPFASADAQACGRGDTCVAITLGPGVPDDVEGIALQVPDLHFESLTPLADLALGGYALAAEALDQNTAVRLLVFDPIRAHYPAPEETTVVEGGAEVTRDVLLFPRTFETLATPGACAGRAAPEAPGWTAQRGDPIVLTAGFDDGGDPHACVSVRPDRPRAGPAVAAASVRSRALVARLDHAYTPPVEVSPLVFLPLFDLELPSAERCRASEALVASTLFEAATEISASSDGAEVLALDPVEIAAAEDGTPCVQTNQRSFSARAVADRVLARLDDTFGASRRVRVVLVYATNLDLALPPRLSAAIRELQVALDVGDLRRQALLAIGPAAALASIHADERLAWIATEEPAFLDAIKTTLAAFWPSRTLVHDARALVPLLAAADVRRFRAWRVCHASTPVVPHGTATPGKTALVPLATGPAYSVELPSQILIGPGGFVRPTVSVTWEGCEGLCDHAAPGARSEAPWDELAGCLP